MKILIEFQRDDEANMKKITNYKKKTSLPEAS